MSFVSHCEQKLFRLYFSWTKGRLSWTLKPCRNDFVVQNISKVFFLCYHLQCSFKIFIITVFTFLYVMANSKEIGEEI